jgi:hypothetical protein
MGVKQIIRVSLLAIVTRGGGRRDPELAVSGAAPCGLERVALNRVHPIESNRNSPGLCWSWIAFYLNQIEGNTL